MNYIEIKPELTKEQSNFLEKMAIKSRCEVWYTMSQLKEINNDAHADFIANDLRKEGLVESKRIDNRLLYRRLPNKLVKVTSVQYKAFNVMNEMGPGLFSASSIGFKERTLQALYDKGLINCVYSKLYHHPNQFHIFPTIKNMGIKDIGEMSLLEADSLNIPIGCFVSEENGVWNWMASNYTPKRCDKPYANMYHLQADSKEKLLWAVNQYVVPLYKVALSNLEDNGETR